MYVAIFNTVVLAFAIYVFHLTAYPTMKESHQFYEANRIKYGGWTLPWPLCFLWWFGLEGAAPKFMRRQGDTETAELWLADYFKNLRAGQS
ncbi:hypothetical protein CCUG60885_04203 [Mycobacteroides salmoniphilum]|uniref:Uncharacterized protein n=2 Tax=Mycobacteroides salmoniphilum TaxID=404941 RepID=A0A4R8SBY5_9MYCO|nr:hypothetical protein CCUG60885_04203 [Mycobacteroides salmoniphilum]TEA07319.1 hypothetical protein CCUG60883_01352 [Mycobacteroides salmoniphilum]